MIFWIFLGSVICSIIYAVIMSNDMRYFDSAITYVFPSLVIWNWLSGKKVNIVIKVITTSILSVVLFAYVIGIMLLFLLLIVVSLICDFIEYVKKKRV